MAVRITVTPLVDHARADQTFRTLKTIHPKSGLREVAVVFSYTIDASFSKSALQKIARELTNPVIEKASIGTVLTPKDFSYVIEIGYHPGVTDNVGNTAREMIENALGRPFPAKGGVYSSIFIFLSGRLSKKEVAAFALTLHNPLIERAVITERKNFKPRSLPFVPKVTLTGSLRTLAVDLNVSDEELIEIGKKGIKDSEGARRGPLALSLSEMKHIRDHFNSLGRKPTDIEIESLAQTWSEHCKHTIFNDPLDDIHEGIYKRYIRGATEKIRKAKGKKDFCDSVFVDNAGAIEFDDEYLVTHKVETHNSPSALDPFGGAITGIVGVNRDAIGFGLGAKPIANTYGFCVGNPKDTEVFYRDKEKAQPLLSAKRILEGVVRGINEGGNQSGIPTPLGFVATDARYKGKPLVFAGTVGLIPKKKNGRKLSQKRARPGDYVVMIGGRVGMDGIHGATFSSEALSGGSPATAVQIGDPITQKKLSDALIREARDQNLYSSLTDNGAGGLSCSVAEMAKECGGFVVDLEKVPTKYPGMQHWQIWISESQERMTLSVPKKQWTMFKSIMDKHDVEATRIGEFNNTDCGIVRFKGKEIFNLSMNFLHEGRIPTQQTSTPVFKKGVNPPKNVSIGADEALLSLLARPNIGSYAFISRQYDHEVQGTSVTKPLHGKGQVNTSAGVLQPLPHSKKGLVVSNGYTPWYSDLCVYDMAASSLDIAVRSAVVTGGSLDHLALLDNFCWSSGNTPERLYELKEAARACYEGSVIYGTPFISGKDSMFNDFKGFNKKGDPLHVQVPPTLLISSIGVMRDTRYATTIDLKKDGNLIYLLGETHDEIGGSEYAQLISEKIKKNYVGEKVPKVNFSQNKKLYRAFERANKKGLVSSAASVERGGIAVTLSKMAIAGKLGADVSLQGLKGSTKETHMMLFSESQGRIIAEVSKEHKKQFESLLKDLPFKKIGSVNNSKILSIKNTSKRSVVALSVSKLSANYQKPFSSFKS